MFASSEPTVIQTILGSCVSVCLFDPVRKVGGMNHILLPGRIGLEKFDDATRYGIHAMEMLINSIMKLGSLRKNIISKVFGGAHLMRSIDKDMSAGPKNVRFVEEFLKLENILVKSKNTGGNIGRKIYFHTNTGDVFLKKLPNPQFEAVAREERRHTKVQRHILDTPADIELFPKKR